MHKQDFLHELRQEISKIDKQWTNAYRKFLSTVLSNMAANLNTFSGTFQQFIYLFAYLQFVPYIRYHVNAKAKRKTRAQHGQMWQLLDEPEQ